MGLRNESGFLVVGLSLLMMSLLVSGWIIYATARMGASMGESGAREAQTLREASDQTQLLNRLAINNSLQLVYLERALKAHLEATMAAVIQQNTVPFWKADLLSNTLSEHRDLESLMAAQSTAFANNMRIAYGLTLDSTTAYKELTKLNSDWRDSLQPIGALKTLCIVIEAMTIKDQGPLLRTLETLSLRDVETGDCKVTIGGFDVFQARDMATRFETSDLKLDAPLGLMTLTEHAPLLQRKHIEASEWNWSPAKTWLSSDDTFRPRTLQLELIHPALSGLESAKRRKTRTTRSMRNELMHAHLRSLLEPNWVPVLHLSKELPWP